MAALAGDAFAGRRVGSAGGAAARAWLTQQLDDAGATVTFEAFTVPHAPERGLHPAGGGLPLVAGPVASDNRRHAAAGLAAVGIEAGMAGYHSPADTPEHVEPATLAAVAQLVVATGLLITKDPATVSSLIGDRR
ncbi:hypothetical protein AB0M46_32420 [Dactylosporangium sp. NPDC051485]|uniref:hypothetical protein n=1 Tax=Dactylosporangium sp. NPDC051485 TaxID=3154846 RepID=UPI00342C41EF